MATNFFIFAPAVAAEADSYREACNALWTTLRGRPGVWYPPGQLDINGYTVVAKLAGGPFLFAGEVVPETTEMAALRANGVEIVDWVRPPIPEE